MVQLPHLRFDDVVVEVNFVGRSDRFIFELGQTKSEECNGSWRVLVFGAHCHDIGLSVFYRDTEANILAL